MNKSMNKSIKTYEEAVNYITSLSNIVSSQKGRKEAASKLKNLQSFLKFLGNPQNKLKVIHIAGTSGKGSVAMMIHSILCQTKNKVGVYTSPHTSSFLERIKINKYYIKTKELVKFTNILKEKLDEFIMNGGRPLGFLEFTVALAFFSFVELDCQYAVIETGVGGRYDATNLVEKPIYTIITNIGRDHLNIFSTMKNLVYEKLGIIKYNTPFLTGEKTQKWLGIFEKEAVNKGVIIKKVDYDKLKDIKINLENTRFIYKNENYKLKLLGKHQARNAILAIECALDLKIEKEKIKQGLYRVSYPARLEIVKRNPTIIIDSAHNKDKLNSLLNFLLSKKFEGKKYLIFGTAQTKEIKNMIPKLKDFFDIIYLTRYTNPFRKCADLSKFAKSENNIYYKNYSYDALNEILTKIKKHDVLIITGSIFLAGELREYWYSSGDIIKKRSSV